MLKTTGLSRDRAADGKRSVSLAIVHHANQYIISNGYTNQSGIRSVVGSVSEERGLAYVLELHRQFNIPANIHVSGTLLEALAWFEPQCLALLRKLHQEGLLEILGSAYGQNIMRFFGHQYNVDQLNEEFDLCQLHLGVEPKRIKAFWPPERVWDTAAMAPFLRDPALRNGGFDFTFLDDRLLLPVKGENSPRLHYDQVPAWDAQFFHAYPIVGGQGLTALPIAENLRHCIPPRGPQQLRNVEKQLTWLRSVNPDVAGADLIAIYADDMEKSAAIGWDPGGPSQFEQFLRWLCKSPWVNPLKISDWATTARIGAARAIEGGTYSELAVDFGAGELYEKWHGDSRWSPYRGYFEWSERRVHQLNSLGANPALIALAKKHLLASSWETAWHTPATGAHGDVNSDGGPSGSSRAIASHSRHAAVIAEAAYWQAHKDGECHCYLYDIDDDGKEELILKNSQLFAVVSPWWGGRLLALFAIAGAAGAMVIGNPTDDWNLKEELNDYMDVPRNHPGALADVRFEHDSYAVRCIHPDGRAVLVNQQAGSLAFGLTKEFSLSSDRDRSMEIEYHLPDSLTGIEIEFGLSPDYLNLLRQGCSILMPYESQGARGWRTKHIAAWIRMAGTTAFRWMPPHELQFGHGYALRVCADDIQFSIFVGTDFMPTGIEYETAEEAVEANA